MLLRVLYALIVVLPEVIKFIQAADERADEIALAEKVRHDFQIINQAFATKDAKALNDLFKS